MCFIPHSGHYRMVLLAWSYEVFSEAFGMKKELSEMTLKARKEYGDRY
jgi:hypothetical protein